MADPCEIEECVDEAAVRRHGCWKWFLLLGILAAIFVGSQLGCSGLPGRDGGDADSDVTTGETGEGNVDGDAAAGEGTGEEQSEGEENSESGEMDGEAGEAAGEGDAAAEGDTEGDATAEGDADMDAEAEGEGDMDAGAEGDAAAAVAPTLAIAAGAAAGSVDLSGTAAPNSSVEIVVDGTVVGNATADADGNWQYTAEMPEGDHEVLARATGADGSALESEVQTYAAAAGEGEGEAEGEGEGAAEGEGDADTEEAAGEGEGEGEGDAAAATDNIPTVATNAGTFNTLLAAVGVAGLTETLQGEGPFTVFAPTDEAFAALPDGTIDALLANPDALKAVLLHHVVAGQVGSADLADGATLESAGGTTLTIAGGSSSATTFDIDNAGIAAADIAASNGLIHVVDSVILPPADIAPPVIDVYGVPTFEGTFLTVVGLGEPNTQLLLEIDGEEFGRTTVTPEGTWLVDGDITSGERNIIAYTVNDAGLPIAVSTPVDLIVK